jgi:hypothetical protein
MREEMRVVIVAPHLNVREGEIDVDNMRVGSKADAVVLDGAPKVRGIPG